jgi:catechol 2,3-dioxygenase-like lactoylglutathione lyase family enzyme
MPDELPVPSRVSLVTLGVADVARSTAFYESLGWRRSAASTPEITFFHTIGPVLGLFGRADLAADATTSADGSGFRGVSISINVASAAAVDSAYAAWIDAGGRGMRPPGPAVFEGGHIAYVADPDDHLYEFAHNPYFPMDDAGHVTLPDA